MGDKKGFIYNILNYPLIFIFLRSLLDGGQVKYLKNIIEKYQIESILDIGCGCGSFSRIATGRYVGIDYNPKFISYSSKKYSNSNKSFFVMDARTMELSELFDAIILINTIHHFSDGEVITIIRSAKKYSKRYIIIHDLVPQRNPISWFFYYIDRGSYIRTIEQQKDLVIRSGLEIKEVFYKRTPPGIYLHSTLICKVN